MHLRTHILGILLLQVPALKALKDYRAQKKQGIDPQFDPRELGIEGAQFWEQRADGLVTQGAPGDPAESSADPRR